MLISLMLTSWLCTALAQTADTSAAKAAQYFAEAKQAADNQTLWPKKLYGPMLLVEPESRRTWANEPDSLGLLKPVEGIYTGVLPADIIIANTAISWEGKTWSVIQWPLPANREDRLNLMTHELFHRIQRSLGLPPNGATINYLGSYEGRLYLLLELQALKAALNEPVGKRRQCLATALMFREKRQQLFPATYGNERLQEMHEGLAEYTGVMTGRRHSHLTAYLDSIIDHVSSRPTLIRAMAYVTGPVYGYLLYQKDPQWTFRIDSTSSFPKLIRQYYHIQTVPAPLGTRIAAAVKRYHAQGIIDEEKAREKLRLNQAQKYTYLFTKKPVLEIRLQKMDIGFNPNTLFDLGQYGTVYTTVRVTDVWGELQVSKSMLMKDWKIVYLPVSNLNSTKDNILGDGWELILKTGWHINKTGPLHYQLVAD